MIYFKYTTQTATTTDMLDYKKYFEGKKITKQGFGFLGRGANVVKFLLESGASVLITDMKSEKDLEKSVLELDSFIKEKNIDRNRIEYRLGQHNIDDFVNCDYVIQASGVPKDNPYLAHAKENGIKVYQEGALFAHIVREYNGEQEDIKNKIKIIGITGTRGKTTTTFLIKKIIEDDINIQNIKNKENKKVYFGGNVQGVATLEILTKVKGGDVIVMELDSWVLQGFKDINYSPEIAVFTNIMRDHMNYYKNNMQEYFLDKANIFLCQKEGDAFFSTENIMLNMEKYIEGDVLERFYNTSNKKFFLNNQDIENINKNYKSNLLGEHNKINIGLAITVAEYAGIEKENIQNSLSDFYGAPGRMERLESLNGVEIINDTCATTGEASMAALESFKDKNIILITGGRDKELDTSEYAAKIIDFKNKNIIKDIFLLLDDTTTGTKKLIEMFEKVNFSKDNYVLCASMDEAVKGAALRAAPSDLILFTPAFASFGMFENEYDRGEKFIMSVNALRPKHVKIKKV